MKVRKMRMLLVCRPLPLLLGSMLCGCTGPTVTEGRVSVQIDSDAGGGDGALSPDRLADLEQARAWIDEGRWAQAESLLTWVVAVDAVDRTGRMASVWLSRCEAERDSALADALARLVTVVAASEPGDDEHLLATMYQAWVQARQGNADAAGRTLVAAASSGAELPWELLAAPDRAGVAGLLVEGLLDEGLTTDRSASLAMSTLERVALEAGADETLLIYAYDRALEVAERRLTPEQLSELWETGTPFVRGTVAGAFVNALTEAGEVARAAEVLRASRDGMTALGLDFRAAGVQAGLSWSSQQSLRTGVLVSMTAGERQVGRAMLAGLLLVQRTFEAEPPASTLAFADIGGSAEQVEIAMRELAALDVALIIGPPEPALAARARQVAVELGIGLIDTSVLPLSTELDGVVHLQADPRLEAAAALGPALEAGARSVAIVSDPGASAQSYQAALVAAVYGLADQAGLSVLEIPMETAAESLQEMAALAARQLSGSGADAYYMAVGDAPTAALAAHLANLGQWPAGSGGQAWWMGNSFSAGTTVRRDSARYVEGMVFPAFFEPATARGSALTFVHRFEQVFGRQPASLEAFSAVAGTWARELVAVAGGSAAAVKQRLAEDRVFDTMLGPAGRDAFGNVLIEPVLLTMQGGEYVRFTPPQ